MQKIHIIDTLGPFFAATSTTSATVNWSKVNFSALEKAGRLPKAKREVIAKNFERYITKVVALGYDSISIDDLAHLVPFPFYSHELQLLVGDYRLLYQTLFTIAKKHQLHIFVTTDYLFYNQAIRDYLQQTRTLPQNFFLEAIQKAVHVFPEIDGLVLRIGENDGKDVSGAFLSQLQLHTPQQANALLKTLLPFFEQKNKKLIFRTWAVGAYPIGDLPWNKRTFEQVFAGINSKALIISMKFGDTDFMRNLQLNPFFFHGSQQKLLELQTRREWEGMGTYPSFVGQDYEVYFTKLANNENVVGMSVWCQTGGWAKKSWTNLTYLNNSSFWNELNTEVTIDMYKKGYSLERAVRAFCQRRAIANPAAFLRLLELSDIAIKKGLYFSEIAEKTLYFRRSRLPTLLWLTWDTVLIQPLFIEALRIVVTDHKRAIKEGQEALLAIEEMEQIATQLQLSREVIYSLRFQRATYQLFCQLREYIFLPHSSKLTSINKNIGAYMAAHPEHYTIPTLQADKAPLYLRIIVKIIVNTMVRTTANYCWRDRVALATSPLQKVLVRAYLRKTQSSLASQAMGVAVLFE